MSSEMERPVKSHDSFNLFEIISPTNSLVLPPFETVIHCQI